MGDKDLPLFSGVSLFCEDEAVCRPWRGLLVLVHAFSHRCRGLPSLRDFFSKG
jgi:hypothetical protein